MAAVMALTVELMRMVAMALFIMGIAMAVRIVPTSNTIMSSGMVKPRELFCFPEKCAEVPGSGPPNRGRKFWREEKIREEALPPEGIFDSPFIMRNRSSIQRDPHLLTVVRSRTTYIVAAEIGEENSTAGQVDFNYSSR